MCRLLLLPTSTFYKSIDEPIANALPIILFRQQKPIIKMIDNHMKRQVIQVYDDYLWIAYAAIAIKISFPSTILSKGD